MTLRKSENVLRALVALALGFGFVGFATASHGAHPAHATTTGEVLPTVQVQADATPIATVGQHAGI